ncbi:alkaline phosphatase family protein [Desmospora profundinema]|uniref:AlkP superfamily pyrophosphatase or phosphodiesterase n=1 Tax=Desmospora profundinema TaxID=1571184 RepID=A0ABU1IH98_9BACL|nr:alkaline phosphatase family protein [Desmospora profundinema]MDR6224149.1 putative AlkP superfamily pyrophosphatase or phosphodiesterase [Desmospora profundinema]
MKWLLVIAVILGLLYLIFLWTKPKQEENDLARMQANDGRKKVIWLMVDSIMSHAIDEGVKKGELPALAFLIQNGHYQRNLVSSFPTMSVTIDSSLLTGTYPNRHRVPGLIWYDTKEERIVNYGTGAGELMRDGINQGLKDAVIRLNRDHLNPEVPTLYEKLADRGFRSGSFNGMLYRGKSDHVLSFPPWLTGLTSLPSKVKVKGPDFLTLGMFSNPLQGITSTPDGLTNGLGMGDSYPLAVSRYLIKQDRMPDFTFVYLPDLDKSLHDKGPSDQSGIRTLDREIAGLLDTFDSWEEALHQYVWVICGDSGQTGIHPDDKDPLIPLHKMLQDYRILPSGEQPTPETDLVLCVNERMAYIYLLKDSIAIPDILDRLRDDRIDLLAWEEEGWIRVRHQPRNKELRFRPGSAWTDDYGQSWEVEGEFEALDLSGDPGNGTLSYRDYPDGLMRLYAVFHSHPGRFLVVTPEPGYELVAKHSPTHKGGGGHGSLHRIDSLVPLIIAGTDQQPKNLRIVDLKDYILHLMDRRPAVERTDA